MSDIKFIKGVITIRYNWKYYDDDWTNDKIIDARCKEKWKQLVNGYYKHISKTK